jgi:hypothetical protein
MHDWVMEHDPDVISSKWDLQALEGHNFGERASEEWAKDNMVQTINANKNKRRASGRPTAAYYRR